MQVQTPRLPRPSRALGALAVVAALALTACGSDSTAGSDATSPAADTTAPAGTTGGSQATDTTAAVETTTVAAAPADALTIESGFSTGLTGVGTQATSAAAVVTNTSDAPACGVEVTFRLLDAAGTEVDGRTETVTLVPAGAAVPVAPKFQRATDTPPASLEAEVSAVAATCEPSGTALGIAIGTADVAVDADRKYVRGTLQNETGTDAPVVEVQCALRDAAGAIVGGDSTTVREPLAAGAEAEFKVRVIWSPETATAADCAASA